MATATKPRRKPAPEITQAQAEADSSTIKFLDELPKSERTAPTARPSEWIDLLNQLVDAPQETHGRWARVKSYSSAKTATSIGNSVRNRLEKGMTGLGGEYPENGSFEVVTRGADIIARYVPGQPQSAVVRKGRNGR